MSEEATEALHTILMSPTMEHVVAFARDMPLDKPDMAELRGLLTKASIDVVRALDSDRIQFDNPEDHVKIIGLLAVALEIGMDRKFSRLLSSMEPTIQ